MTDSVLKMFQPTAPESASVGLCSERATVVPLRANDLISILPLRCWVDAQVRLRRLVQCIASLCCIAATTLLHAQTPDAALATPSDADAISAFLAARAWLDEDTLPAVDAPESRVALADTAAVCVLLRLDGRVVGAGEDAATDAASRDVMVRKATGRAVAAALGDELIRTVRASLGDRITARLSLEIELAGPTSPLIGRTIAQAAERVEPGIDGLVVLRGASSSRAFPSRLLAYDNALRSDAAITALMRVAGLAAKELTEFAPEDRVSLGRFRTIRLRQATFKDSPTFVARGGRLVELSEITPGFTRTLATQLCARLCAQVLARVPNDPAKGVMLLGTYEASADTFSPPIAAQRDSAFAAFALARAAVSNNIPAPMREKARAQALALARTQASDTSNMHSPAADAFAALAFTTCLGGERGLDAADSLRHGELVARIITAATTQPESPELAALLCAALASSKNTVAVTRGNDILRQLLDAHAASVAGLIDAALPLALLKDDHAIAQELRARVASALTEIETVISSLQITRADGADRQAQPDLFPSDLEGGLLLPRFRHIRTDAQCLRLACALALAFDAKDAGETPARAHVRRRFVRFLAQHVAADPWVDGYRSPQSLRGLVRSSLASSDCPPAALAAGLLLATSASLAAGAQVEAAPALAPSH